MFNPKEEFTKAVDENKKKIDAKEEVTNMILDLMIEHDSSKKTCVFRLVKASLSLVALIRNTEEYFMANSFEDDLDESFVDKAGKMEAVFNTAAGDIKRAMADECDC